MLILMVLWSCQVLMIDAFYRNIKTEELKKVTNEVISDLSAGEIVDFKELMFEDVVKIEMQN